MRRCSPTLPTPARCTWIDRRWRCNPSDATTDERISKWDRDGNFLGQMQYNGTNETFVLEGDYIYTLTRNGAGSSTTLFVQRCTKDFDLLGRQCDQSYKFDFRFSPAHRPGSSSPTARIDSERGLLYLNDRRRIFVFDISDPDVSDPPHVGTLNNGERVIGSFSNRCNFGSSWTGFTMELDSAGALYVLDSCTDRVHKFEASALTDGEFEPGAYVGWMGRCDSSTNKACDLERGASKGYSCTDATCGLDSFTTGGEAQGQFSDPEHLAMDPNDVLYVADSGNARVQRFAPDGTFAGEAISTGTGVNQGDRPGFVLGNMGNPRAVSVNSTQFFVTDRDEQFVHVFQTSPFKDITENSATVTYVSEFDFHSAEDSFTFAASDGLATSAPATARITVNRNFRRPEAFAQSARLDEDSSVTVTFDGDDPDGIAGVDFNGLDTLSYRVIQQPAHGSLSGSGTSREYTPDADFNGTDFFLYVANDGFDDSLPARVDLTIDPVDDAPRVTSMDVPSVVGLGFETPLRGQFFDDGSETYGTSVNWGDGTSLDSRGDFVTEGDVAIIDGVKLLPPATESAPGQAVASHKYTTAGMRNVQLCVWDQSGAATCENRMVEVKPTVMLDLNVMPRANNVAMGGSVILDIAVTNLEPEGVAGLTANGVRLTQTAGASLELTALSGAPAGCRLTGGALSCDLGSMAPGAVVSFEASASFSGARFFSEIAQASFEATTTSDSTVAAALAQPLVSFQADMTDSDGDGMSDGWETAFGLNPNANDAAGDLDGDGLDNASEFARRTEPNNADSDNDGISDGVEVANGGNPTVTADTDGDGRANDVDADDDNDGMSDLFERNNGLDALDAADALADMDGDGASNLAEAQAGTAPDDASDVPASAGPAPTLFSSVLPLNRSTVINDTVGAFATLINAGSAAVSGCSLVPLSALAAEFSYQATDPLTNAAVGEPNTPVSIDAGAAQTFLFTFTPRAELDVDVELRFACDGVDPAPAFRGLNTFRLQASVEATPDLVALAATASGDGIVNLSGGAGAFSVASVNVGATDWLTVRPSLPAGLNAAVSVCQTDPLTGLCINPTAPAQDTRAWVENFGTPTFSVFVAAGAAIDLDPIGRRVLVEFVDDTGTVRGATSVALQYQP